MKIKLFILNLITLSFLSCNFMENCVEPDMQINSEEIVLEDIRELKVSSSVNVYLSQSETQKLMIEAPANYIELLNREVNGQKWDLKFSRCLKETENVKVFLSLPTIKGVMISGSGSVIGENQLRGDQLKLEIHGSGDMDLDLDMKKVRADIEGSGDIQLMGNTKEFNIEIDGSGDLNAINLITDNCTIEINGSGDAQVSASYSLDVEVNGSGDVEYSGNPKELNSSINGSGSLKNAY